MTDPALVLAAALGELSASIREHTAATRELATALRTPTHGVPLQQAPGRVAQLLDGDRHDEIAVTHG